MLKRSESDCISLADFLRVSSRKEEELPYPIYKKTVRTWMDIS